MKTHTTHPSKQIQKAVCPALLIAIALGFSGCGKSARELVDAAQYSDDKSTRMESATKLSDQKLLAELVINANDADVRTTALRKLKDQEFFARVAAESSDITLVMAALEKVTDQKLLIDIINNSKDRITIKKAIEKITDKQTLAAILKTEGNNPASEAAFNQLFDSTTIKHFTETDGDLTAFREILKNLPDKQIYALIAKYAKIRDANEDASYKAICRISDKSILSELVESIGDGVLRLGATKRISAIDTASDVTKPDEARTNALLALRGADDFLANLARNDKSAEVRRAATFGIVDQQVLAGLAKNPQDEVAGGIAVSLIKDKNILADLARSSINERVRLIAANAASDMQTISELAKNAKDSGVQSAAKTVLEQLTKGK